MLGVAMWSLRRVRGASCRQLLKLPRPERIAGGPIPTFSGFGGAAGDPESPMRRYIEQSNHRPMPPRDPGVYPEDIEHYAAAQVRFTSEFRLEQHFYGCGNIGPRFSR